MPSQHPSKPCEETQAAPSGALMGGLFKLDRALIRVSGPDARPFLQNLLTQDVDKLDAAGVLYAALLSPQGKVNADMFLWADGDGVVIDADPARGADLLRKLSMYKLRADVEISDVGDQFAALFSSEPFAGAAADPRLSDGSLGWRAVRPRERESSDGANTFERVRLAAGVPDFARDAGADEVFALEALLEELNGVAFHKGCFVGQENVSRMKRRATTRKKFCPISFEGEPPPYGAVIQAGEAEIGAVRTGMPDRAIALVRLDRALEAQAAGTPLTVAGREVRLAPPPWLIPPSQESA